MKSQALIEITAVALGLAIMLAFGCASIQPAIDAGIEAREAYEQRKADEAAARQAAAEAAAQAERDRIEADRMAAEAAEQAEAEKYKDGPSTPEHGRRGFLWKPISDTAKKPVLLLPPRFTGKTRLVTVNGARLMLNDVDNGYREHYRMNQHFTNTVTVQAEASDGIGGPVYRWTWVVADPSVRNDSNITPSMERVQ